MWLLFLLAAIAAVLLLLPLFPRHRARRAAARLPLDDATYARLMAPHAEALARTRRPVAHITLAPMAADDRRASKVGGAPWWPAGTPLPQAASGEPLVLLAQLALHEVPPALGLPRTGLLQFFVTDDDLMGLVFAAPGQPLPPPRHAVVHWPDATGPAADWTRPAATQLPFDGGRTWRMAFRAGEEAMGWFDHRFVRALGGDGEAAVAAAAAAAGVDADAAWDAIVERSPGPGHKLGGYPNFTQDDPRQDDALELLLQLDSQDDLMWGDCGVGNFFIRPDDLARGDFSRVVYSWDCC